MERQVNAISKVRRYITLDACKTLAHALVISRLDYGNALLYGLPSTLMTRLQKVQNSSARKALDAVPHRRLIKKLEAYGIKGGLLIWIENFLSERDRLETLRLPSLCYRKRRGDMLQVYEILKGIDRLESNPFFSLADISNTSGNICTDNAKNMERMQAALQQDDPDLTVYGCSAHWLNLLGQDLTTQSVMKHIVEVQKNVKDMADQLRPVANAIDCCQADSASLAAACDTWLSLLDHPKLQSPALKHIVVRRLKQAILPEHLTAYKLHPEYQGAKLSAAQTEVMNEFLVSKYPTFISELITFQAKSSPYPKAIFTEAALSIDTITWWNAMKPNGMNSDFVVRLLHHLHQSNEFSQTLVKFTTKSGTNLATTRHQNEKPPLPEGGAQPYMTSSAYPSQPAAAAASYNQFRYNQQQDPALTQTPLLPTTSNRSTLRGKWTVGSGLIDGYLQIRLIDLVAGAEVDDLVDTEV
ncbi:hypothetical protein LSH36_42g09129 [Paralvinella palmiformis]|uniref:Uncharacterized protein n=1 Tax=Paralvinella palmiformis TaxID=53620 RepID=A0AAD9K7X7_9ANNE|nr:hypothetical protein LSH36_42g09129 [Paralvinella palmiformis]